MVDGISVVKNEDGQIPVPLVWRSTLKSIVDQVRNESFNFTGLEYEVEEVLPENAISMLRNVVDYGATLKELPDSTWDTSVCQWMIDYWEIYVDLYTVEEGESDLVLAIRVYENAHSYRFQIQSILVP